METTCLESYVAKSSASGLSEPLAVMAARAACALEPERWHWVYTGTCFRLDHRGKTAGGRPVISERGFVATRDACATQGQQTLTAPFKIHAYWIIAKCVLRSKRVGFDRRGNPGFWKMF